jgi:hypothetical protein
MNSIPTSDFLYDLLRRYTGRHFRNSGRPGCWGSEASQYRERSRWIPRKRRSCIVFALTILAVLLLAEHVERVERRRK